MKAYQILPLIFFLASANTLPQGTAGTSAKYEYRYLIDMPTAGILKKGLVGVSTDVMPEGVVIARIEAGVFDQVNIGISYGGANIIGAGAPEWYKLPAVNIRFRALDEGINVPSITFGFDSQGKGEYFDSSSRYALKSPGFFAGVSKNFELSGFLSLHGALNYSLEDEDGDNFVNLIFGLEKTLSKKVSLLLEYDFALNDNTTEKYGSGSGYLNIGIRWNMAEGLTLGFDLRDLLQNKKWKSSAADRALKIEYVQNIF